MKYSVVNYSQIDKLLFRLEAEFYNSSSLLNITCFTGATILDFVQYGTSKELNEEKQGFPTLRLNEFESFFIGTPQKYCSKIDARTFNSLSLKKGDVLICRTNGNPKLVGKSAIVPKDYNYAFASYLFRIRPDYNKILPTTLVTYLNSKVGRAEIEKYLMVSNQANFSPAKFREILIPIFGDNIQSLIDDCIWESFKSHEHSISIYSQAKLLLLSELSLTNWQPNNQLTFIKNFNDIEQSERIDAEYFQPKYDEIIAIVKDYRFGYSKVEDIIQIKDDNFFPECEQIYKYIELANIGVNGEITGYSENAGKELPTRARRIVNKNDLIISSIEGSLSSISLIDEDLDNSLCSTGFYVVNSTQINSETLFVFFKSIAGQLQLKKGCNGTILTAINKDEFSKIVIPLFPIDFQKKIKEKITEMYFKRSQSKQLIELAKQAVELAIEEDETKAIEFIKNNLASLNINIE